MDNATLNRAFQLAHSIYRYQDSDRATAFEILDEALRSLDVRMMAQSEADRHIPRNPSKVRWNTSQWLQILIYCKSERYEKQEEDKHSESLSQEDMIIRYIKHLILTTCRRNSFHISLGLSRLLYDYGPGESMAIYDFVFQDLDSSTRKADAYYRARKNKLIEELARRFNRFLRISEGIRGTRNFERQNDSSPFNKLVTDYLTLFTPWDTRCELPENVATWSPIQTLQTSQESQIHCLTHPACFSRITKALKLDAPETRLALPKFFSVGKDNDKTGAPGEGPGQSELTSSEVSELRDRIAQEVSRRRRFTGRSLSVVADGHEIARLDLRQSNNLRLDHLEEGITLIELVGTDKTGELLLASFVMVEPDSVSLDEEYSIVLEGGQKISLTMIGGGTAGSSIQITYQETRASSVTGLWWTQVKHRFFEKGASTPWTANPSLTWAMAIIIVTLIGGAGLYYLTQRFGKGEQIAKLEPAQSPTDLGSTSPVSSPSIPPANLHPKITPSPIGTPGPTSGDRRKSGSLTREPTERATSSLAEIEKIYIESFGSGSFSEGVRARLMTRLQAGGRLVVSKTPDEADTAISGSARQTGTRMDKATGQEIGLGEVSLQFVNIAGETIWRTGTYRGTADQIAEQVSTELQRALKKGARRSP